jgi:hypothetical protein
MKWTSRWKPSRQVAFLLAVLLLGCVGVLVVETPVGRDPGTLRQGTGRSPLPWFEISLYVAMLLGMAAKYGYDAIGEGSHLTVQKWQLVKPMLVSPMVFGAIYGNMGGRTPPLLLLIFAFQNGFFWKTVLEKTPQASTTRPHSGQTRVADC